MRSFHVKANRPLPLPPTPSVFIAFSGESQKWPRWLAKKSGIPDKSGGFSSLKTSIESWIVSLNDGNSFRLILQSDFNLNGLQNACFLRFSKKRPMYLKILTWWQKRDTIFETATRMSVTFEKKIHVTQCHHSSHILYFDSITLMSFTIFSNPFASDGLLQFLRVDGSKDAWIFDYIDVSPSTLISGEGRFLGQIPRQQTALLREKVSHH